MKPRPHPLLLCLSFVFLQWLPADPPEDLHAWTAAPHGWQLERLGPSTVSVDLEAYETILYVAAEASGPGEGTRAAPYSSLARALKAGAEQPGRTAVLVATGTYREAPYTMVEGVDLFGGFHPSTWERDLFEHPTRLSGEEMSRVLVGADDAILDGFIVSNGRVVGHGAGLYCRETSPTVTNNRFENNLAVEPGDYSHDHDRRRQRAHDGGAIALVNYANPAIHNNIFVNNSTGVGNGAAISAADDCIPQIGYNVFWENRAGIHDHAITRSGNGAAVSLRNSSRAAIFHNLFVGNQAHGGSDAGALFFEYFSWPEVRWNVFLNNYASDDGGAMDSQKYSHPKVKYNLLFGNQADGSGGGAHHDDSLMEFENNIFAYNVAQNQGGAFGGSHGWIRAINNTVVFNEAVKKGGGAVHHYNMKNPHLKQILMRNNIFWGNQPDELFLESGGDVYYNIVEGGYGNAYGAYEMDPTFLDNGLELHPGEAIYSEPRFVSRITLNAGEDTLSPDALVGRVIRRLGPVPDDVLEKPVVQKAQVRQGAGLAAVTEGDGIAGDGPQYRAFLGSWWSLIRANGPDWVEVWGPVALYPESTLEIIPTFHLHPDSPAINNGLYTDYAPDDIDGQPRYFPTIDFGADEYVPEN